MITAGQVSARAAGLVAVIGLATLIRSVREYILQGTQKRAEAFLNTRKVLADNPRSIEILALAQDNDPVLIDPQKVTYQEKFELLGYFEEVAFMVNSGLIKPRIAWYMFGYYVLSIDRSENFWCNIERSDIYWSVFNSFAKRMMQFEVKEARRGSRRGNEAIAARRQMRF